MGNSFGIRIPSAILKSLNIKANDLLTIEENDEKIVISKSNKKKISLVDRFNEYNGEDLTKMSIDERSKKGIFYLSQNPIEIEGVTNAEMLRSALECRTGEYINFFEFNKRITEVCKKLNIPESFIHRGINESMSGGERKKNELMHLYMLTPSLVILDELDSGLDVDSLKSISDALKEYFENEVSYLIVTHHISILEYLNPTKVCVLKNGSIVKTGDYELAKSIEKNGFSTYGVSEEK